MSRYGISLGAVVALVAFVASSVEPQKATAYTRTYPLQTADVGLLTQAIRQVIGENPLVIHYRPENQLLITATEEEHRQVQALLAEINVPSPNVRLDVRTVLAGSTSDTATGVKDSSGEVEVTREGARVHYRFRPQVRARSTPISSMTQQTLVVQSGREASLMVGQDVPFFDHLVEWGKQWGLLDQELLRERTGAFLVVRPQVIGRGPMLQVTLIPELREWAGEKRKRIRFTRVETTVTVRDGETIQIGGGGESQEFFDTFLVGIDQQGAVRNLTITLTPRILTAEGIPAHRALSSP